MATRYFAPDGAPITRDQWKEMREDQSRWLIREYQNDKVAVGLEWLGRVSNAEGTMREYWPLFKIKVLNLDSNRHWQPDPVEDGKTFPDMAEAIKAYEEFLVQWTSSEIEEYDDGERVFVEKGNILTPPPPPDPDKPVSQVQILDDGIGAW